MGILADLQCAPSHLGEGTTEEISFGPSLNVMLKRLCHKWALGDLTLIGAICELKLWLRLFHEEFKMQGYQLILGMHNQSQVTHSKVKKKKKKPNFR